MEWKIVSGQVCVTAIIVACIFKEINHSLIYAALGGLLASIGYPFTVKKET